MYNLILEVIKSFPNNTNFYSLGAKEVMAAKLTEAIKENIQVKLSNQAMGAIMMALQKSLLEQSDIIPVLKSFDFQETSNNELTVKNPPNFQVGRTIAEENNKTTGSD